MSKIVKRVSPYRGIFVRRDRANTRKTYNEYFSKPHKYKKITVGKPIEERMLKRRRLVLDGEDTDSEYDENLFPEGFEAMPRDWKLSDLDEMRRKTREERFIPAICHVSQQKRSSIKLKKLLASNQSRRNEGMGIRSPHLQTRTIKERDEEDDDEEWSEDEFDEDDSNDDELSSEEEMYIGPEFYNKSLPVDVGPSTPKSSRPSGVRFAPTTPSTSIASVNPIAVTTTPPTIASPVATPASPVAAPTPASPPFTAPSLSPIIIPPPTPIPRVKKSLDEVFEDNYSMLMAIIPVVPLHCE